MTSATTEGGSLPSDRARPRVGGAIAQAARITQKGRAAALGALGTINPVARLLASVLLATVLLISVDVVTAAVALALEILAIAALRVDVHAVFRFTWVILVAAPLSGLTAILYGSTSGTVYAQWWWVTISQGSMTLGLAMTLRGLSIAVPSLVMFYAIDPTDLADGLEQILRLPSRFVVGGLAGMRLFGLLVEDWRALGASLRSRGLGDAGRLRRLASQSFALLVLSIRRATKLSTAMEARAFGGRQQRTWARRSRMGRPEWVLLGACAGIAAIALVASSLAGTFHLVLS